METSWTSDISQTCRTGGRKMFATSRVSEIHPRNFDGWVAPQELGIRRGRVGFSKRSLFDNKSEVLGTIVFQFKIPNIPQICFLCFCWCCALKISHAEAVTSGMALGAKWRLGSQVFHQQMVAKKKLTNQKREGHKNTPKVVGWGRLSFRFDWAFLCCSKILKMNS